MYVEFLPHKLLDLSLSLITNLSSMFYERNGFSIKDAIEIYRCIKKEYEDRVNSSIVNAKIAPIITDKLIEKIKSRKNQMSKLKFSNFCHAFFWKV